MSKKFCHFYLVSSNMKMDKPGNVVSMKFACNEI